MKTYICEQCGIEVLSENIWYRYYMDPTDRSKIISRSRLCLSHYALTMPTETHVAFDPLWALGWWAYVKKKPWWGLENSKKIYRFNYKNRNAAWAYAIVINGDYQDIKEAHVASAIHDGWVPDKISFEELISDLKNSRFRETSSCLFQYINEEFPELVESLHLKKSEDYDK